MRNVIKQIPDYSGMTKPKEREVKTLILIFVLIISTFLFSTIINVPADQPTIQAGINATIDADTVLVQPGTYIENINYNGMNITVASLFLTTQDTIYISQTILDGNQNGSVVKFVNGEDSMAVLMGFSITNGAGTVVSQPNGLSFLGGGIYCVDSSPILYNLIILDNGIGEYDICDNGGGIYLTGDCSPSLVNVTISGNSAQRGGGICFYDNSSPSFVNVTISGNSANSNGGGMCCYNSNPNLQNVTLSGNYAELYGGGIYCEDSNMSIQNVTITCNSADNGGGIYCDASWSNLEDVTIKENFAYNGGGIYCSNNSNLSFNPVNRCNMFLNFACYGCDLYAPDCSTIDVIVDTFTVLQANDYFAFPIDNFTFDILNAKVEQVDQDLYVNPDGSNNNSGLTVDDPLLTISYALAMVIPSSTNPLTIHLSNGTYSHSGTGEMFPLNCRSHVSLLGGEETYTILDGEGLNRILFCQNDNNFSIENMTIQNGSASHGGGIYCWDSSPSLVNITISGNSADSNGGGIYFVSSNLSLENVTIIGNSASDDGGGIYFNTSSPSLQNILISGNSAGHGGGIYLTGDSSPSLVNVTLTGNSASSSYGTAGGICCKSHCHPLLVNSILYNNSPVEIYLASIFPSSITISYSDIQGGEAGIVTNNYGTVYWLDGNIDEDPLFVGTGGYSFSLLDDSPCIDTGNPDPIYYDPEDPSNPGYALYPAMGTIINDMGAYGGPNAIGWLPVGIEDNVMVQAPEVFLHQNYPNPFNPTTTINYTLNEYSKVSLNIYNIKGQEVKQLVRDQLSAGQHSVVWDGKDDNGKSVSSGLYFYKLKTDNHEETKKMILMK